MHHYASGFAIPPGLKKLLMVAKLTLLIITLACGSAMARLSAQTVTLKVKNEKLEKVFKEIKRQTGYDYVFNTRFATQAKTVTVEVKKAELNEALRQCFENQPFTYELVDKIIVIKEKPIKAEIKNAEAAPLVSMPPPTTVHGKVTNEKGEPVAGVTVAVKGSTTKTSTNDNGEFTITVPDASATLVFSAVTIETFETKLNGRTELALNAKTKTSELEEVVVNKGYYTEKQRLSTGNVTKIAGETINKQPVSDPLMALQGRVPGLYLNQNSGIPGATSTVQLRGQNSIPGDNNNGKSVTANDPLYIVDGVPVTSSTLTYIGGALGNSGNGATLGLSPFNSLNNADIESIEVLKDADATAIYGSRGANGVILITTRKGKEGRTKFDINIYTGAGSVARKLDLMNTQQYLMMRREAYKNDGILTLPANAYDVNGTWDTTRHTDWQKAMIGNTAHFTNVQASLSGGTANTQFLMSAGHSEQTTVYPKSYPDIKNSFHFSLTHASSNRKFNVQFSGSYTRDNSMLPLVDFASLITLAPNAPALYDENGNLNWANSTWANPIAATENDANAVTDNLISNLNVSYQVIPGLTVRANTGFTHIQLNQTNITRLSSFNPVVTNTTLRKMELQTNDVNTWIAEPQINYSRKTSNGKLDILLGMTFQQSINQANAVAGTGYSSDALIPNLAAATTVGLQRYAYNQYNYEAFFGRVNYNWQDKYLVNLTGRRDGSSRFGPGKQFGNFGAVGMGWIFSKEKFVQQHAGFLSFGKIRFSYGITGNDQLSDYQFLSTYSVSNVSQTYQGIVGLNPTRLVNPDFRWEEVRKLEAGMDLGFLQDRVIIGLIYYSNRTDNQLVGYALPGTAGITTVQYNLPALIQNSGFELEVNTRNIKTKDFSWTSSFNISAPRNKLLAYPNIDGSSYQNRYSVGKSLSIVYAGHYVGTDPQTGLYTYEDLNKDGVYSAGLDNQFLKSIAQEYYGGFSNIFSYKGLQLDIFFQFAKQTGYDFRNVFGSSQVGVINKNVPIYFLDRWQRPGDITDVQKFSTSISAAGARDGSIQDASFIRLKNVALSYTIPTSWRHLQNARIYIQAQNLLTITSYKGWDPETRSAGLPPLRMITAGIQFTF